MARYVCQPRFLLRLVVVHGNRFVPWELLCLFGGGLGAYIYYSTRGYAPLSTCYTVVLCIHLCRWRMSCTLSWSSWSPTCTASYSPNRRELFLSLFFSSFFFLFAVIPGSTCTGIGDDLPCRKKKSEKSMFGRGRMQRESNPPRKAKSPRKMSALTY